MVSDMSGSLSAWEKDHATVKMHDSPLSAIVIAGMKCKIFMLLRLFHKLWPYQRHTYKSTSSKAETSCDNNA